MRRLVFLTAILPILVTCSDDPAGPAWTVRVTGAGEAFNVNTCNVLHQNVSAEVVTGMASGQIQIDTYLGTGTYPDCVRGEIWFQYDAVVTDLVLGTAADGSRVANVCYDVTNIRHPAPFPITPRFGLAIKDGAGVSADMTRRAADVTCLPGEFWGDNPNEGFSAVIQGGNYMIEER